MELKKETHCNQKLQPKNKDLVNKFDKSLLERDGEISHLKDYNKKLPAQINQSKDTINLIS
jgi:hypothetical protein